MTGISFGWLFDARQIEDVVKIAVQNFSIKDRKKVFDWVGSKFDSNPVSRYFMATKCNPPDVPLTVVSPEVVGYALWTEHGGFRPAAFMELEQFAVAEKFQGQGIGRELLAASFTAIKQQLVERGSYLATLKVTTSQFNIKARVMYNAILGVETEHNIKSPYHQDQWETEMFARFPKPV